MAEDSIQFGNLRIKRYKLFANMVFLKQCRNKKITPSFAKCLHNLNNRRNKASFDRLSVSLVRNKVKKVHSDLVKTTERLLSLHLKLSSSLRVDIWLVLDAMTFTKVERLQHSVVNNKQAKLENLSVKQNCGVRVSQIMEF